MLKLVRVAVLLLFLLISPVLATPAAAQAPGCQDLLPHGVYEGSSTVVMDIRGYEGTMLVQRITWNDTG